MNKDDLKHFCCIYRTIPFIASQYFLVLRNTESVKKVCLLRNTMYQHIVNWLEYILGLTQVCPSDDVHSDGCKAYAEYTKALIALITQAFDVDSIWTFSDIQDVKSPLTLVFLLELENEISSQVALGLAKGSVAVDSTKRPILEGQISALRYHLGLSDLEELSCHLLLKSESESNERSLWDRVMRDIQNYADTNIGWHDNHLRSFLKAWKSTERSNLRDARMVYLPVDKRGRGFNPSRMPHHKKGKPKK